MAESAAPTGLAMSASTSALGRPTATMGFRPSSGGHARGFVLPKGPTKGPTSPDRKLPSMDRPFTNPNKSELMQLTDFERPATGPSPGGLPMPMSLTASQMSATAQQFGSNGFSPYDENQRLRRELNGMKKRCRQLETELARPLKSRIADMKGAYFPSPTFSIGADDELQVEQPFDWEAEMKRVKKECGARLKEMTAERDEARDEIASVKNSLTEQMVGKSLRDREQKAELMRRQIARRMLNSRLTRGWTCWTDLWRARSFAIKRLRQVAAHLQSPELARAFSFWNWHLEQKVRIKHEKQMAVVEKTLEGKLRQSQFEAGQLAMLKVAHEDEIKALQAQVTEATDALAARERELQEAAGSLGDAADLREELEKAKEKAKAAEEARYELSKEMDSHRQRHESLLQRLLAEQRERLEEECKKLQRQIAMKSEEAGSALSALKESMSAEAAAKAKEERVELLRRQSLRRIKNKDIAAGWAAWFELWSAKTYAMARLRECGNKLHTPGLMVAFGTWAEWWTALKRAELEEKLGSGNDAYAALQAQLEAATAAVEQLSVERNELRTKVTELDGGVSEATRLREEAEAEAKEERVELMRKQAMRRIANKDIAAGWAAWFELWEAKTYAMNKLKQVGNQLHSPLLANAFGYWSAESASEKAEGQYLEMAHKAAGLNGERDSLAEQLARVTAEYEQRLAALEEQRVKDLERQLVALTGTADEQAAMLEEKAKEERIELMKKQSMRRMLNAALSGAWGAWLEMWEAKVYATERLKLCGNRLHAPEKTKVFTKWKDEWRAEASSEEMARLAAQAAGLDGERTSLAEELRLCREELANALLAAAEDKRVALERLTVELSGTAEEVQAMQEAKAKEERIELMKKQAMRRVANRDIAAGWAAWFELWEAKTFAMNQLRETGNRLRNPAKLNAFKGWLEQLEIARQEAKFAELQANASSLDTQLRRAKADKTHMTMVVTARDDEIAELKSKLREAIDDRSAAVAEKAAALGESGDAGDLKAKVEALTAHLAEAERRAAEAEEDGAKQRAHHEALIERLLREQRERFESEKGQSQEVQQEHDEEQKAAFETLAAKLAEKEKEHLEATIEIDRGLEANRQQAKRFEEDKADLQHKMRSERDVMEADYKTEIAKLMAEIKDFQRREQMRLTQPQLAIQKQRTAAGGLANNQLKIYLDEGPDALPIAQQIAAHLRANAARVLDLFREWDTDNDGVVSRAEFHRAMPKLGLDVSEAFLDELFDKWRKDGDADLSKEGGLQYQELATVLRRAGTPSQTKPKLKNALASVKALQSMSAFGSAASGAASRAP